MQNQFLPDQVAVLKPRKTEIDGKKVVSGEMMVYAFFTPPANGVMKFLQFERNEKNELDPFPNKTKKHAVDGLVNNATEAYILGIRESLTNSDEEQFVVKSFPFLDAWTINHPTYPFMHEIANEPQPVPPAGQNKIMTDDRPFEIIDLGYNTDPMDLAKRVAMTWMKTHFVFEFRTYVGLYIQDTNNPRNYKTFQPMAYLNWSMTYKFKRTNATDLDIVDDGSSRTYDAQSTKTKQLAADEKIALETANHKTWRFKEVP